MNYLELVEEYKDQTAYSQFDKVKIIANRTRDLYAGKISKAIATADGLGERKPSTVAQYEVINGFIEPDIYDKEETGDDYMDGLDLD